MARKRDRKKESQDTPDQDELSEDEEFDTAFNEGPDTEAADADDAGIDNPDGEDGADDGEADDDQGGDQTDQDNDQDDDDQGDDQGESEGGTDDQGQAQGDGDQGEVDWKARYDELEHKTRSWEGRLSAASRENNQLKQELAQLKASRSAADNADDGDKDSSAAKAVEAAEGQLSEFFEEYPDLKKPMQTLLDQAVNQAVQKTREEMGSKYDPLLTKVEQQEQSEQERLAREHEQRINEVHPDVDKIADDLNTWVEELPAYRRNAALQVMQEGATDDVIALLDEYKQARGKAKPRQQQTDERAEAIRQKRQRQAEDSEPVKAGKTRVPNRTTPDPNDFDGAFEEAAALDND